MTESMCPRVVEGIERWLLFPEVYVIGSLAVDRYISVPAPKAAVVHEAVALFDGTRSFAEISEILRSRGHHVDVAGLYTRLCEAGLIAGSRPPGELARLGVELFEIPVARLLTLCRGVVTRTFPVIVAMSGLTMLAALFAIFANAGPAPAGTSIPPHNLATYSLFGAAIFVSILLHELSHAVAALRNGLAPAKVRVNAYLLIIPVFLLVIPGLYTIPPARRVQVWLAGIWGSLTVGSIALLVSELPAMPPLGSDLFAKIALANALIAVWNLLPFLPTDGYFVATTLLRRANVRSKAWQALAAPRKSSAATPAWIVMYGIVSALLMLALVIWNAAAIAALVRQSAMGQILAALMAAFVAAVIWRRRRRQSGEIRQCQPQQ